MSEEDFVMAWLLASRANGKVSWASGVDTARVIAKQARAIYRQLMEEEEDDTRRD
jgi:hypothetical protein